MKSSWLSLSISVVFVIACHSGCDSSKNNTAQNITRFETMTIFKPDTSKDALYQSAEIGYCADLSLEEIEYQIGVEKFDKIREERANREQRKKEKEYKSAPPSILRLEPTADTNRTAAYMKEYRKKKYIEKIDHFVYDLNELTMQGWEIKSTRRVWVDLNDDDITGKCEWGTEYILQRKIQ